MTLVRPEFEPTLPVLVRRKLGVRERTTILVLFALLALAIAAIVLVRPRVDRISEVVHRDAPAFTLQYRNDLFHDEQPEAGELARLAGRRGRQAVTITVRPFGLPGREGNVAQAFLPIHASGHIEQLGSELDGFELRAEHRARVHDAPGYEVRFRSGARGRYTFGSDLMLLPSDEASTGGLLLSLRREIRGSPRLSAAEEEFADLAIEAMRSVRFGTGPGLRGPRAAGAPILGTGRVREAPRSVPSLRLSPSVASRRPDCASLSAMSRHTA